MKREEVLRVLRAVRELSADKRVVLIGGQAVAWWVTFFDAPVGPRPASSKDIDFEGSRSAAEEVASLLGGEIHVPSLDHSTPNTGLVVYIDPDGEQREIDFLNAPLGLREEDVQTSAILVEIPDEGEEGSVPLWVLHPERCMESRVANVMVLKTRDEMAMDQLRASIACAQRFSALLLDEGHVRDVLALNERVFRKCLHDRNFRDLFIELAVDPFDAVLVDERLGRFVDVRYPQMRVQLAWRRAKDAVAYERRLSLSRPV